MEMIANGVAAICAFFVYKILQNFIVVKRVKNLWGLANKKDKMMVSKETFENIGGFFIFIIAIFVFTYVEEAQLNIIWKNVKKPKFKFQVQFNKNYILHTCIYQNFSRLKILKRQKHLYNKTALAF